ncbi:ankyrin repeat domain-containing protein [Candidatus Dependentiae bacterium]|nr:ankyrin repeat domain-containing protein [Candidatus Dependentiae bacterium]
MKISSALLSLVIQFNLAVLCMDAPNQTSINPVVYLPVQGHHHVTSLRSVLTHVTGYQPVIDSSGNHKLLGFHHYQPQKMRNANGLTLVEVSDKLWVLTNGDIKDFHVGYVIYNGHYYHEPKTFFPITWPADKLTNYIVEMITNYFNWDTILEPFDIQAGKTPYSFSTYKFKLKGLAAHEPNLIVVVKLIPAIASSMHIVTIYPEVLACGKPISPLTLEKVALQQKTTIQKKQDSATQHQQSLHNASNSNGSGSQRSPLEQAAQSGDWQLISTLLKEDANFYEISNNREQALFCAISCNDFYSTLSLLNKKTINTPNKEGVTPLIYALTRQAPSIEILELLLSYGSADANMSDRYKLTPLMHALRLAYQSNDMLQLAIAITQLLLDYKADPNKQDSNGNNALCYAIVYLQDKAEPFIKILLKAHADPTAANNKGDTALSIVQKRNFPNITALLQKHIHKKNTWLNERKATELMYASYRGNIQKVSKLLAEKALIHAADTDGHTALYLACIRNHLEVIELLLAAGADTCCVIDGHTLYELVQTHKEIKQEIKDVLQKAYAHQIAPLLEQQQQKRKAAQEKKATVLQQFKQELSTDSLSQETLTALQPYVNSIINTQGETPFTHAIKAQKYAVIQQLLNLQLSETNIDNAFTKAYTMHESVLLELLINSKKLTTPQLHSLWNKAQEQANYLILDLIATMLPDFRLGKILDALTTSNKNVLEQLLFSRPQLSDQHASLCLFKALELNESSLLEFIIKLYPQTLTSTNHLGQTPVIAAAFEDRTALFEILYNAQPDGDLKLALLNQLRTSKLPRRIFDRVVQLISIEEALGDAHQLEQKNKAERVSLEAQGYTSLMLSVYFKDVVDSTDSQKINAQVSKTGITPLMLSTRHLKNTALLKLLSMPNIDIHAQDSTGKTALTHAIEHGNTDAIYHLTKGGAFLIPTHASQTALKNPQAHTLFNEAFIVELMPILIRHNDIEAVRFLLTNRFTCFAKDKEGKTALHYAIDFNQTEIVLLLLDAGIPLDGKDKNKLTALEYASKIKATTMHNLLLCYQTDPITVNTELNDWLKHPTNNYFIEQMSNRRVLAFIAAAIGGYDDVITLLLSTGFNDSMTTLKTAFFEAMHYNKISTLALLLEHGVDINSASNSQNITGLMIAAYKGHIDCINFLIKHGAKVECRNTEGQNALDFALEGLQLPAALLLLEHGMELNYNPTLHDACLQKAAYDGNTKLVELLLKKGVNPHVTTGGTFPLLAASEKGHTDMVELLLNVPGVNPNAQDKAGQTALIYACNLGHNSIVKLLIEKKANLNLQDKLGFSPLIVAIEKGFIPIVAVLVAAGANLNVQNDIGITALWLAAYKGYTEIVELLLNPSSVDSNTPDQHGDKALTKACVFDHNNTVKLLLARKANPNLSDKFGNTPLMIASDKGLMPIAKVLLEAGANPNIQTKSGTTALLLAALKGHTEMVRFLLNAGADTNLKDENNETALIKAVANGHIEIVKLLLATKSDLQTQFESLKNALKAAKHKEIKQLLIAAIAQWQKSNK